MTSKIMEKKYFYILSAKFIISTQYQLLVSSSTLSTLPTAKRSSTYWVFWYYGDSGDRQCGNYCIVAFSLVAFLLLCIILCGCLKCYFIRQRYKEEDKYTGDTNIENALASLWPDQARKDQEEAAELYKRKLNEQYPPLNPSPSLPTSSTSSNNNLYPLPTYDDASIVDEPNYFHNLRRRSPYQASRQANKFSKEHPPFEAQPPLEHMNYIQTVGIKAWKFYDENLIKSKIISVSNDIITFKQKLDAMVQTNYPLIRIFDFNEKSVEISDNNDSSGSNIGTIYTDHKIIPKPSQAHLLSSNNQNHDLSLEPPPYESPSSPTDNWTPGSDEWFHYYEVTIISNPNKATTIAIGLATKPYPNYRLPGWHDHSVGYHSVDGKKYHNENFTNREYGEKWGEIGDTIGCGYNAHTGYVFFTKNGKFQGIAFTGLFHTWFPTIGSDDECTLQVNFGDGKDFMYQEAIGMSICGPIYNKTTISNESVTYKNKNG